MLSTICRQRSNTMETLNSWITNVVGWIDMIPITGWAMIAGLVIGSFSTQWIKRTFPIAILMPTMALATQKMIIRITAFIFSFCPTFFIWPDKNAVWAALAVGFCTPTVYKITSFCVYKKWPDLRARLSGVENES